MKMNKRLYAAAVAALLLNATAVAPYPLDGYGETGIRRLEANRLAQEGKLNDVRQPPGALLHLADVQLRLAGQTFDLPPPDPAFTREVQSILSGSMESYAVAVLDLTDPAKPRYAEQRGDHRQNVGSVGKLVVVLALFQALADIHPDIAARQRVLKETVVTADGFSQSDSHTVRIYDPAAKKLDAAPGADRRPRDAL